MPKRLGGKAVGRFSERRTTAAPSKNLNWDKETENFAEGEGTDGEDIGHGGRMRGRAISQRERKN